MIVEFTVNKEIYFKTLEHFLWGLYTLEKFIIFYILSRTEGWTWTFFHSVKAFIKSYLALEIFVKS